MFKLHRRKAFTVWHGKSFYSDITPTFVKKIKYIYFGEKNIVVSKYKK